MRCLVINNLVRLYTYKLEGAKLLANRLGPGLRQPWLNSNRQLSHVVGGIPLQSRCANRVCQFIVQRQI
jgi:hypothetical protein